MFNQFKRLDILIHSDTLSKIVVLPLSGNKLLPLSRVCKSLYKRTPLALHRVFVYVTQCKRK